MFDWYPNIVTNKSKSATETHFICCHKSESVSEDLLSVSYQPFFDMVLPSNQSHLTDAQLWQRHFETTSEMLGRGMVGGELWLTGEGIQTHGSEAARRILRG